MAKIYLVSGGCRSGKSHFAESLALKYKSPTYLATGQSFDDEMDQRIKRHQNERDECFQTIEEPIDIIEPIKNLKNSDVLLWDCLTLWLSNLLCADWQEDRCLEQLSLILNTLNEAPFDSIIVSNEVGMGIVPESKLARQFRDLSGFAHQLIAPKAEEVYLVAMGIPLAMKKLSALGQGHD